MKRPSMSADLAAARARAKASAPGLDGPVSGIPSDDEASAEANALSAMDANVAQLQANDLQDAGLPPHIPDLPEDLSGPSMQEPELPGTEKAEAEPAPIDPIEMIASLPNGPSKEQLLTWKAKLPEVLFLPLRDGEVYIYRYLNSFEWRKQILTQEKLVNDQEALRDAVVQRCLLWPRMSPIDMNTRQAGLRDLLYEVVMQSSYFIDPQQAMGLVMRL